MWKRSQRSSNSLLAATVLIVASAAAAVGATARDSSDARFVAGQETARLVREILSDRRYQKQMPADELRETSSRTVVLPLWGPPRLLVYLGAAVLAILGTVWLLRAAGRIDFARDDNAREAAQDTNDNSQALLRLRDAERLAAEERFTDAVHVLLIIAIHSLGRRVGFSEDPARTSREILRNLPPTVPAEQRDALAELIRQVEISWFGGRALGATDYERCHRWCRTLVPGGA